MRKMNDIDRLARDIAFEIVLGGDRFDPSDVAEWLPKLTKSEKNLFENRIKYHAVDFAPEQYRTDPFLNRSLQMWTGGIAVSESTDIGKQFLEMWEMRDRGCWFELTYTNGKKAFSRCEKATASAMWASHGGKYPWVEVSDKPVPALEVARCKVDDLLRKYGSRVNLDGPVDTVDIGSYGMTNEGHIMSVRRSVDELATSHDRLSYYVTIKTPGGSVSNLLSNNSVEELDRLIDIFDTEMSVREGMSLVAENPMVAKGSIISLPDNVYVTVKGYGSDICLKASTVFLGADGRAIVSGREQCTFDGERNYPVSHLSDASVAALQEATSHSLRQIEKNVLGESFARKGTALEKANGKGVSMR